MKGFKVFNPDWTCKGFKYEVGKTYEHDGELSVCNSGFHFCQRASDCFNYYGFDSSNRVAEVVAYGKILTEDNKSCTNKIKIVREVAWSEVLEIVNIGKNNTGHSNTGNRNTGDSNTGNRNTGDWNTGNRNTGDSNTGNRNTGDWNTGYWNTGDRNTGYWNTGNRNTGDWNTGNRNTGDWNCTDRSAGFFCTEIQTVKIFDVDTGKTYEELSDLLPAILWNLPFGYYWFNDELKPYTAEDRQNFYDKLNDKVKKLIKSIPHFNAEKFEKCTGIKVED